MQKTINIIIKTALAVIATVLACGCISEKMDAPEDLQNVLIEVNVSADRMATKATEDATEEEKVINSIRIYAFYNGKLAGHYFRTGTSDDPIYMDLELPKGKNPNGADFDVDFYVAVNEESMRLTSESPVLSATSSVADLQNISFDAVIAANGIPMYYNGTHAIDVDAVSNVPNTISGHVGHVFLTQKVKISLERPLSKLAIYAAKMEGATHELVIKEAVMLARGTRQFIYLMKPDEAKLKSVAPRLNDRNLLDNGEVAVDKSIAESDKDNSSKYTTVVPPTYVSEVPFGSDDPETVNTDNSMVLYIKYSAGVGTTVKEKYVYMPVIERNSFYKVLCLINPEGQLIINYKVADWEKVDQWQSGMNFDYPTHSYIKPSATSNANPVLENTEMKYVAGNPQAFKGYFQMLYPQSQGWKPSLIGDHADDYIYEVYKYGETVPVWTTASSSEIIAGEDWYEIRVIPKEAVSQKQEVKLAISFTPAWADYSEHLLINGSKDKLYWPCHTEFASMQSPEYIILTQIP